LKNDFESDYPLQGSSLDLPLREAIAFSPEERKRYILRLLKEFSKSISANEMALKRRVPFQKEMRDLRRLVRYPYDKYLFLDELTYKRNVLGRGSPGGSHTYWSRKNMWRMTTRQGDLARKIQDADNGLIRKIDKYLDGGQGGKKVFWNHRRTTIQNLLTYLELDNGVATAFPPFHARFFAEKYLPSSGRSIVVDPCAGWGGRLLGTLCVNRLDPVMYIGIDPEKRNREAYENLYGRVRKYLRNEISGERYMQIFYRPFEDWVKSTYAKRLNGLVDLVFTSPPYFSAEVYNTDNKNQSANRYTTYEIWREQFYRVLIQGAFDLLKPGGTFVLNIANVTSSNSLEKDARILAREVGFSNGGFYKLAMSIVPGTRTGIRHRVVVDGIEFKHEPCFVFQKPVISNESLNSPRKSESPSIGDMTAYSFKSDEAISRILEIFKKYKKDYFPHVWNTTLKNSYLKGNIWLEDDVAIVFNQYKRAQRLGCVTTKMAEWQIKQIAAMNQGDGSASRVLKKFLLKANGVVWLTVRAANHRARRFYEKHGFKEVSKISWSNGKLPGVVYRRSV
jgi:hypothetical protein